LPVFLYSFVVKTQAGVGLAQVVMRLGILAVFFQILLILLYGLLICIFSFLIFSECFKCQTQTKISFGQIWIQFDRLLKCFSRFLIPIVAVKLFSLVEVNARLRHLLGIRRYRSVCVHIRVARLFPGTRQLT
jgi:hypothetical protein